MSYHLYIKKRNVDHQQRSDIALEDWLAVVEGDEAFSFIVDEGDSGLAIFEGAEASEQMIWSDGNIDVDTPSEKLLDKMVVLADTLGGKVIGATGELYPESRRDYLLGSVNGLGNNKTPTYFG